MTRVYVSTERMTRHVWREGRQVSFFNNVGPYFGKEYKYEFPTEEMAMDFEKVANSKDEEGNPVGIPPEVWGQYELKEAISEQAR